MAAPVKCSTILSGGAFTGKDSVARGRIRWGKVGNSEGILPVTKSWGGGPLAQRVVEGLVGKAAKADGLSNVFR